MSDPNKQHIVDYHTYCPLCKFRDKSESDDPCWDCLQEPVNENSTIPTSFREDKKLKRKKT